MKTKKCEFCGKEFQPRSSSQRYCKGPHMRICPACGKEYEEKNSENLKKPPHACSYACRAILTKRTSLEKYGCAAPGNSPEARKKASQTMMNKLGVPYAMMSKDVRDKSKDTMLERYGVENAAQSSELLEKRLQTNKNNHGGVLSFNTEESYERRSKTVQERYGKEVLATEEVKSKIRKTMIERYGHPYMMQVPEFRKRQETTMFEHYGVKSAFSSPVIRSKSEQTMLEKYGVTNPAYSEELMQKAEQTMMERYGKSARVSKINEAFASFLDAHCIQYTMEHYLKGKWYDFYLPDKNIVIEIDPTYTHNAVGNHWGSPLPNDYHIAKTNLAKEFGLRCIHIFDWDDWDKIIDLITDRKPIYARQCKIYKLNSTITNSFLKGYHLQSTCRGQLLSLGLVYNDDLVQVMTFGKPRYDKKYNVELLRLATKAGYQVVGGASKLFSYATKQIELSNIISYCNVSKFSGSVYEQMGMKLVRITEPQEIWSRDSDYVTANYLRQRGYDQIFHSSYGKGTSNEQLMLENHWLPIYDCGQYVFEFL